MRAGLLRNRIILQVKTVTRNAFSEAITSWDTLATLWAQIETISGTEAIEQQQAAALLTHKITIRSYPALQPTMRVLWNSRVFDVQAVLDDNRNRQTVLLCSEVVSD